MVCCSDAIDAGAEAVGPAVEGEDPDAGVVAALAGLEGSFGGGGGEGRDEREKRKYGE